MAEATATKGNGVINLESLTKESATKIKCLVLGATMFDFENDKKERIMGSKVHFVQLGAAESDTQNGWLPTMATAQDLIPFQQLKQHQLPAYFEADMLMAVSPKNVKVDLRNFKFLAKLEASA